MEENRKVYVYLLIATTVVVTIFFVGFLVANIWLELPVLLSLGCGYLLIFIVSSVFLTIEYYKC